MARSTVVGLALSLTEPGVAPDLRELPPAGMILC